MTRTSLKDWNFYFRFDDGAENRHQVIKAIVDFLDNTEEKEIKIPGKVMLGGAVYNRNDFRDGELVTTSYLQVLEKKTSRGKEFLLGTTLSGTVYWLSLDEHDSHVSSLLEDMRYKGKLNPSRYWYAKTDYWLPELF